MMNDRVDGRRPGGDHWAGLIDAARRVQTAIAGSNPDDETVSAMTDQLNRVAATVEPFAVGERHQAFGRRPELLGIGQSHRPVITFTESTRDSMTGTVSFERTYLGAGGAVHGGIVSLLFDDFFGVVANVGGRPPARTAYLHLDYRALTPIDTELTVTGWIRSEQGRKRVIAGELKHGEAVCAEAEALFIALRHLP